MKKIIQTKDRLVLIKKELIDTEYWEDILESLTFKEGMALASAVAKFTKKYMLVEEKE